jgi:alpha-tubulin suppressor-like RCC1 family protein
MSIVATTNRRLTKAVRMPKSIFRAVLFAGLAATSLSACRASPAPIVAADAIASIAMSRSTACAIRGDGALFCWGDNRSGAVGKDNFGDKQPHPVRMLPGAVSAVAVGYGHACAVSSGAVWCWGGNMSGQIGVPASKQPVWPPHRVIVRGASAVAAGGMHSCAVVDDALYCWGNDSYAQLGDGKVCPGGCGSITPVRVFADGVTAVAAHAENTCAIRNGSLFCWGDNRSGQVGNGTAGAYAAGVANNFVTQPYEVIPRDVQAVAVGTRYVCAVVAHALQCWGEIRDGHFGSLKPEDQILKPQTLIAKDVTAVAAGTAHVCAIVAGALQCFGNSSMGDIRVGYPTLITKPETVIAHGATAVAAGAGVTCVLVDGDLRCRGYDGYGTALTIGRKNTRALASAEGDVRTLDNAAANAAAARARLPSQVADYLVGKLVTDGKFTYAVTRASARVDKDIFGRELYTHMSLDVVPLLAIDYTTPTYGSNDTAPIAVRIPPVASCGANADALAQLDDHTPFLVLKGDNFVAVNTATSGVFAKLAPMASGGTLLLHTLQLDSADLTRIGACAKDALARIEQQPLRHVDLYAGDKLLVHVPATLGSYWFAGAETSNRQLSKIVIEPRAGSAADYSIDVRAYSSMACGGMELYDWKHGESIPWQLGRYGNAFDVFRQGIDNEDPTFPSYTTAELRAAIDATRRAANVNTPIDAATCGEVITSETYTIRKGDTVLKQIVFSLQDPIPVVPFDCDGEPASLAVHVASDLGYAVPIGDDKARCKAMPDHPGRSIVAIAHQQKPAEDADEDYDLDVAIVDSRTRHVIARALPTPAFTSEDGPDVDVSIDTGRYHLAPGVRAFGIREESENTSRYSPDADTVLNLYVRDGKHLRKVLDGLLVDSSRGDYDSDCTGHSMHQAQTIDVGPSSHHGFADLIVTSSVTESTDSKDGDDCKSVETAPKISRMTLKYDGRTYPVPNDEGAHDISLEKGRGIKEDVAN